MNELDLEILKNLLKKKLDLKLHGCLRKMNKKWKPKTIEQLVELVKVCLQDSSGVSESDYKRLISELDRKLGEAEEKFKDIKEILNDNYNKQKKEYKPRTLPKL